MSCSVCGVPTLFSTQFGDGPCINCLSLPAPDSWDYETDGATWFECGHCGQRSSFTDPRSYLPYDGDDNAYQVLAFRCKYCGSVYDMRE